MTNLIESVAKALKLKPVVVAYLVVGTSAGLFLSLLHAQVQGHEKYIDDDKAGELVQNSRLSELEKADALHEQEQRRSREDFDEVKKGIKDIYNFLLQQQNQKKP